mmetsp:Transcript_64477/g.181402  ORF Transcript_64477/g.181402 Transcript_64477/m.181402 type:complete len:350 (+) Transcript_64477:24-1073(+)
MIRCGYTMIPTTDTGRLLPSDGPEAASKAPRLASSIVAGLEADTLGDLVVAVKNISLRTAYFSLTKLSADKEQLEQVQEEVQLCKANCTAYSTSFTANMLFSMFQLRGELSSTDGIPSKMLRFYSTELERLFGYCSDNTLQSVLADMNSLISIEFKGLSGEKWAMNLLAPTIHKDEVAQTKEGKAEFIMHVRSHLDRMKEQYREHAVILWFLEGLRKSANRETYGFLNFPSLYRAASESTGFLSWTVLGWLVVKLHERNGLEIKLFGTGEEEWKFSEATLKVMPAILKQLGSLHSAIDDQIRKAEKLEGKFLALFTSAAIVVFQLISELLWPMCMHMLRQFMHMLRHFV